MRSPFTACLFCALSGWLLLVCALGASPFPATERGPAGRLSSPASPSGTASCSSAVRPARRPRPTELPPNVRHLRVELAPLSSRAGLRYQTRLDPIDTGWGNPSPDPVIELTRLPQEDYTLHARTLGPNGEPGPAASWSFRVLPPWYATGWATALWSLAAILLVIGYSRLRSRALRQRAARLESRVAEQTLELRHTVAELSRAHAELEVANERLETLSLQDDLTRIANRRHLQQVLESEWKRARRYQRPLGFILLDLDHFKLLNDTRGHLEGDLSLQAVARYLDEAVRRTSTAPRPRGATGCAEEAARWAKRRWGEPGLSLHREHHHPPVGVLSFAR